MIPNRKAFVIILTFILLFISYLLMFISNRQTSKQSDWVIHSHNVVNKIGKVRSVNRMVNLTVYNGLLTDSILIKRNFDQASDSCYRLLKELKLLVADNAIHLATIRDELEPRLSIAIATAENTLGQISRINFPIDKKIEMLREMERNHLANNVNETVEKMLAVENKLLQRRNEKLQTFTGSLNIIILCSLMAAIFFTVMIFTIFRKEFLERKIAHKRSLDYKAELENKIEELEKAGREITNLKNLEKFSSTGRMARTIAHEIRNPLTNINLASEQIKDLLPDNEDAEMLCSMVDRNSVRINELISSLLNATRFIDIKNEKIDLNVIINQALELAEDRMKLLKIKVVKQFDTEVCESEGDPEQLRIAILNIIVNAIEAMSAGAGVLTVYSIRKEDGKCTVKIKDNGKGMSEDVQQKLFDPFFTSKQKGNGLGLTNTQNIILNHRGEINVTSKAGEGTEFEIIL